MPLNQAATGTILALPSYQPGALSISGQESVEIVSTQSATSAASYNMLILDIVGKAPSAMTSTNPASNDLVAFFQRSSGLYFCSTVGSLGIPSGNMPTGGTVGQVLIKNSATNYDANFGNLSTLVSAADATITVSGSTALTIGVTAGSIGSTQIATGGVVAANIATNAVGDVQLRQGAPLSVIGVAGNATANVADIAASASSGLVLQTNAGGTGLTFTTLSITTGALPGPYQTGNLTKFGVVYGNGTTAISATATAALGMPLLSQGAAAPIYTTINIATTLSITGTLQIAQGGLGTTTFSAHALILGNSTSALSQLPTAATGTLLIGQGTASNPSWIVPSGDISIATTGTATIAANAVTFAKFQQIIGNSVLGNTSAATANVAATRTPVLGTTTATGTLGLAGFSSGVITIQPQGAAGTYNFNLPTTIGTTNYALVSGGNATTAMNWTAVLTLVGTAQVFSGGVRITSFSLGTLPSAGTTTLDSGNGPLQFCVNNGSSTIIAPANDGEIDVLVTNSTNASTLTFQGFTAYLNTGDTYTTTNGTSFIFMARRINGKATYKWAAIG